MQILLTTPTPLGRLHALSSPRERGVLTPDIRGVCSPLRRGRSRVHRPMGGLEIAVADPASVPAFGLPRNRGGVPVFTALWVA